MLFRSLWLLGHAHAEKPERDRAEKANLRGAGGSHRQVTPSIRFPCAMVDLTFPLVELSGVLQGGADAVQGG